MCSKCCGGKSSTARRRLTILQFVVLILGAAVTAGVSYLCYLQVLFPGREDEWLMNGVVVGATAVGTLGIVVMLGCCKPSKKDKTKSKGKEADMESSETVLNMSLPFGGGNRDDEEGEQPKKKKKKRKIKLPKCTNFAGVGMLKHAIKLKSMMP